MDVAIYETSSHIILKALLHNVYHCLVCYFAFETSMAEEQKSLQHDLTLPQCLETGI